METHFHKIDCPYLRNALYQTQEQEQTFELHISEDMPDVGRILGVWGQVLVRSKEWTSDAVRVNCGVMVWVLYAPEDGSAPRCAQAWIPFQQSFSHNGNSSDGIIHLHALLRSVDARPITARKLMLRCNVSLCVHAWTESAQTVYSPDQMEEDVCLLKKTYPVCLLKEAGEKPFVLDEELSLPGSLPAPEQIVRYELRCELVDKKVLTDKVIFRGSAVLHLLYSDGQGELHNWDAELPISQYCNLNRSYEEDAAADVCMALTGLELDKDPDGRLRLKAGLTGQYTVYAPENITLAEDAYSPKREVIPEREQLHLPVILDKVVTTIPVQQNMESADLQVVDVAFYPDQPRCSRQQDQIQTQLSGVFHILCRDGQGQLQPVQARWQENKMLDAAEDVQLQCRIEPTGTPAVMPGQNGGILSCDVMLTQRVFSNQGIDMLTGVELGQMQPADAERPSLILRRAADATLWEMAKTYGSTVEAICKANGIASDQDLQEQMLLIPIGS